MSANNSYTMKGKIIKVMPVKTFNDKNLREFVIDDQDSKYPQTVAFQTWNDDLAPLLQVGGNVTVSFSIRGKLGKDGERYWNSLNVWRMDAHESTQAPTFDAASEPIPF